MRTNLKDIFDQLFEIADSQSGYFTAKQAAQLGYSTRMQTYHVQSGDWIREWRGIYRLRYYPNDRPDDLMVWYLWSSNREGTPKGVYSFDTALEIHQLSTWTSNRLHMTVPKDFRRSVYPKGLKFHRQTLKKKDITVVKGVRVTTAVRTILDLLLANTLSRHHLIEALHDARKTGLITKSDLSKRLTKEEKNLLSDLQLEMQGTSLET